MVIRPRNILSLCAGVGGLELGILLALHHRGEIGRGVCYVEREGAAAASLVASMEAGWLHPAPVWSDMLTFDARPWRGEVHILASGDPCQDNSVAGKGAGKDGKRFLAPEVCRLAEECRPDLIFRENVPGNADGQLAAIVPALEALGYSVAAGIFSSSATGNTMRRERLFIMATAEDGCWGMGARPEREYLSDAGRRCGQLAGAGYNQSCSRCRDAGEVCSIPEGQCQPEYGSAVSGRGGRELARSCRSGSQRDQLPCAPGGEQRVNAPRSTSEFCGILLPPTVIPGPTDSRWIDALDRFPELQPALSEEEAQSHIRRGLDAVAHRVERLRATGNGVDPLVAAYAFLSLSALLGV